MAKTRVRVPVSHMDATWLGMDESTNPMVINCIMLCSGNIDYDRLVDTLNARLIARFSRFSQRVVDGSPAVGRMHWESDPHFDVRSHVHHLALPDPGDDAELQRLVSMLMSEPLDRTRPLWRTYLIDNYRGGCAVYSRLHHAIGDGIALMRVIPLPDRRRTGHASRRWFARGGGILHRPHSPARAQPVSLGRQGGRRHARRRAPAHY